MLGSAAFFSRGALMDFDIFEGSKVKIKVRVKRGFFSSRQATIKFTQRGGKTTLEDKPVALSATSHIEHELTVPDVKDDEENFTFTYKVDAKDDSYDSPDTYRVWPRKIELKTIDKDGKAVPE